MPKKLFLGSNLLLLIVAAGCGTVQLNSEQGTNEAGEVQTIALTQTGCQFIETENKDYQFKTTQAEDCKGINGKTLADRKKGFKPLRLKPGKYIFRVSNRDVPYELGFYLRGEGVSSVTLPKVSGGGLKKGTTKDYQITLKPGKYVFSCPLNPTPDYPIVVES
ncbi:MAG: hypothetical protein QNJ51_12855 [Calothrix sp. MO_167.B12]|nr:hypothetical protein [Calothrix sp. MO_167.B12]